MKPRFRVIALLASCVLLLMSVTGYAATLSERTYKRLTVIHELMGENKFDEALKRLDSLIPRVRKNGYEYATVMQTLGFAYAAKEQYRKAVDAFQAALDANALPDAVQLSMRYNLAQLHAAIPDYKASAAAYEAWFKVAETPSADSFVFAATIYAQLNDYPKAIIKIRSAIEMSEKPRETWYQLLLAMYYQQKQYPEAAKVLETMVALFPEKAQYWKQLSGIYFQLKKDRKALAVMELANKKGYLTEERDLTNLVNMYLYQEIPYKGAVMLEQAIEAGSIPPTGKTLQKLGEAWMRAKENEKAMKYLTMAADEQQKGDLYLRISQLHVDKENWSAVIASADKAIATGNLQQPGKAHLLRGMAYYEQGKKQSAMAAFQKGLQYPKSKKQANQWIAHINSEM